MPVDPRPTLTPELRIVGVQVRTSNEAEQNPGTARIGALWYRIELEAIVAKIPNRTTGSRMYAVYRDYESDHTGLYTLTVGCEVTSLEAIPEGLVGFSVPQCRSLVFTADGPLPGVVYETWKRVWKYFEEGTGPRRAYTNDVEIYSDIGLPGQTRLELHVAVLGS